MKMHLILLATLFATPTARAITVCAGETFTSTIVTVTVITSGATGSVQQGSVTISPPNGPMVTYKIEKEDISQFFESQNDNGSRAMVGLAAYAGRENPISIRYSGTNYQEELIQVLRNPARLKEPDNEMRVWKGPGFAADQQLQFRDVVCQVTLDP